MTSVTMLYCDCHDIHGVVRIRQQILRHFSHYEMMDNPPRNFNAGVAAVLDGMEDNRLDDVHVEVMLIYELVMQFSSFLSY